MTNLPAIQKPERILPMQIINKETGSFQDRFNQIPFSFAHNLENHPLFTIPKLVELANTLINLDRQKYVVCMSSDGSPSRTFAQAIQKRSVSEAIAHIIESGSLIFLKSVHVVPEYKVLLDRALAELENLTSFPLGQEITWSIATIIISSPHSVTPYHIDHDSNFLFQIHGDKEVHLFNQKDLSVLTEQEIEQFYARTGKGAIYRDANQSKAKVFNLTSGTGVHHPVLAPHWVKNGNNVSVSLSINFCLKSFDRRAKIYQVNHCIRKLKLQPKSPGESKLFDSLKISLLEFLANKTPKSHTEVVFSGINRLMFPVRFASKVFRKIKKITEKLLSKTPIISDYYLYYWIFPRKVAAYRGIFKTFSEAIQSLPPGSPISHSQPEIHAHPSASQLSAKREVGKLYEYDKPLLPYLKSAFKDSTSVFDFGGNVGVSYYAFKNHLRYPENLRWVICELPELIKAGEKIAKEMDSQGLSFTTDFSEANGSDILFTTGTLQYIEPSLAELLSKLNQKPKHILISMSPFHDGPSFITLQNIGYSFSPYKIQNRAEFISSLASLGYELIDKWEWNRTCHIPFHPECFVRAYYGFYLKLKNDVED